MWIEANVVALALVGKRCAKYSLPVELLERIAEHEGHLRSEYWRAKCIRLSASAQRRRCFLNKLLDAMLTRGPPTDHEKLVVWHEFLRQGCTDIWAYGPGFVRMEYRLDCRKQGIRLKLAPLSLHKEDWAPNRAAIDFSEKMLENSRIMVRTIKVNGNVQFDWPALVPS